MLERWKWNDDHTFAAVSPAGAIRAMVLRPFAAALLVGIAGTMAAATSAALQAQAGAPAAKTTWDGVYTDAQSARGAAAAEQSCGFCHGEKLNGTDMGPGIQGEDFRKAWSGKTLFELYDKIKTTMPANEPGTLSAATTADMVAYILKLNDYPAGATELPSDNAALGQIKLRHEK